MKKCLLFLIFFMIPFGVFATNRYKVTFSKCVDGDTARLILNKKEIKVRFLAIDTPESVHPTVGEEAYGKEASQYTCDKLKNAKKIEIEYDPKSDKTDKYDRHLVWVYIDDVLLQKTLISMGYAEVAYLYDDYLYIGELKQAQEKAKINKVGIWSPNIENNSEKKDIDTKENESLIFDQLFNFVCEILENLLELVFNFIEDML